MNQAKINRFGFPIDRKEHIGQAGCMALLNFARNETQLEIAIETIDRVAALGPIVVCPGPEPQQDISPACKRFYDGLAAAGTAGEVLKIAGISEYFRDHYPASVKWAKKQKLQTPINSALKK